MKLKNAKHICRESFKDSENCFCFYSCIKSIKTGAVLFFSVGRCRFFSGEAIFLKNKMQYSKGNVLGTNIFFCHMYVSFIVHSHLKISSIHHILMKLESS